MFNSSFLIIKRFPKIQIVSFASFKLNYKISCCYPVVNSNQWKQVEKKMKDVSFSSSLFLGKDESLNNIIDTDRKFLMSVNISHKQIVDKLVDIIEKYQNHLEKHEVKPWDKLHRPITRSGGHHRNFSSMSNPVLINNKYLVLSVSYRGKQGCPFACSENVEDKLYRRNLGSHDYLIININKLKCIFLSDLLIHLIDKHGFFEGSVKYRLDPKLAIDVFDLN